MVNKDIIHRESVFSINYIILAVVVSLLNSFFYNSLSIMLILAIVQSFVLIKCLIKDQDIKYLSLYIIFLVTSMESAAFVGVDVFYGFMEFKIAGINLAIFFLILLLIKLLLKGRIINPYKSKDNIGKFLFGVYILTPIAFFMGLFNLLINENDVASRINIGIYIDAIYIFIFVALEVIVIITVVLNNKSDVYKLKQTLMAIIISLAVTLLFSLVFQNFGNRGGLPSLQVSNIIMLLICSITLPFYKNFNKIEKIVLTFASLIILLLGIIYNTNGKMIIISIFIPLIIVLILIRNGKYKTTLMTLLVGILSIFIITNIIVPTMANKSYLFSTKLEQSNSLFQFGDGWYENMPRSPKMRISQFLNISYEYYENPWYLLTGKGFLGTTEDHLSLFGAVDEFDYSKWQIENGLYYKMHETLNTFYLTSGLIGLLFFTYMLFVIIKNLHHSPWIMIGGIWFVFFYGYSITISIFGVTALIIGLFDLSKKIRIKKQGELC